MQFSTSSPAETDQIGYLIGKLLGPGQIVALTGELATGKTTLIKGICRSLGVSQPVDSPTFTLINEYTGRLPVYHIDCYREERLSEWLELGLQEYFFGVGVTLIEWAERVAGLLPAETIHIYLEHDLKDTTRRRFRISAPPEFIAQLTAVLPNPIVSTEEPKPC